MINSVWSCFDKASSAVFGVGCAPAQTVIIAAAVTAAIPNRIRIVHPPSTDHPSRSRTSRVVRQIQNSSK
jgi:hypothetical protein